MSYNKVNPQTGELEKIAGSGVRFTTISGTLLAGETTLTLSNQAITNDSLVDIYTDTYGLNPTNVVSSTGSITLTFEAQQSDVAVKVRVS